MATMNISLPDPMRVWVEDQIENGMYANNSDYVRDLIRRDQQRAQKTLALENAILAGMSSGEGGVLNMDMIKQKARKKIGFLGDGD